MDIQALLATFQNEAADVATANENKAAAVTALTAAQEAVAAANAGLATEKSEARSALDALIAALNAAAEELGI